MATELPEIKDTEIPLPEGLAYVLLCAINERQIRRRLYIYVNGSLYPIPDRDYTITDRVLIIPHPLKTLDVVTIAIPSMDERWYFSLADGWARL